MSDEAQVEDVVDVQMDDAPVSEPDSIDDIEPIAADTTNQPEPEGAPIQQPNQTDADYTAELAEARRVAAEERARREAYESIYSQQMNTQQRADYERQEREKLLNMTAEERLIYAAEQQERRLNETVAEAERRIREANDRAAFAALKATEPTAAKLEREIEKMVQQEAQAGRVLDREVAYTYLLGQKAREAAKSSGGKKAQQVRQNNAAASASRATSGAGDQSVDRNADVDEKAARNERLSAGKRSTFYR